MNLKPEEQNLNLEASTSPAQESNFEEKEGSSTGVEADPSSLFDLSGSHWEPEVRKCMTEAKWEKANTLQSASFPSIMSGKDVFVEAANGTAGVIFPTVSDRILKGKKASEALGTGPFGVLLYSNNALTKRAFDKFNRLFGKTGLSSSFVSTDETEWEDASETIHKGVDILFSTPEALRPFYVRKRLSLKHAMICVGVDMDAAVSKGHEEELEFLLGRFSIHCQKILFSSTSSAKVKELAFEFLTHPKHVYLEGEHEKLPEVEQHALLCETPDKFKVLMGLLKDHSPGFALVFANSKLTASWLHHKLQENQFPVELINAELPQSRRVHLLKEIKAGNTKVLVTTDRVSHDLHIADVSHIYNFDVPENPEDYLDRVGHMGRAERSGIVYTLVCDQYGEFFQGIEELLGTKTPKPKWPKEEYLTLIDKSGNPFIETQTPETREFRRPMDRPSGPMGERTFGERERPRDNRFRGERQERGRDGMRSQGERRPSSFPRGEGERREPVPQSRDRQQVRPRSRKALGQHPYKRIERPQQFEKQVEPKSLLKKILSFFSPKKK
ncbi:MAG: DEAD/DEAH box helicase [Deltaproteobacteria bacterium]|nr:DEAD/DEAH box helicase [Deltaproteobacteria bacterium]